MTEPAPSLSVVIPTFNNAEILEQCLERWCECSAGQSLELVVIDTGVKHSHAARRSP